jgi:hypothetical protein
MVRNAEMRRSSALPKALSGVVAHMWCLGHSLDSLNAEWNCKSDGPDAPGFQTMKDYGID